MTRVQLISRLTPVVAIVAGLVWIHVPAAVATRALAVSPPGVTVTLTQMTPRLPAAAPSTQKVTFDAVVANNTDVNYRDLQIVLRRGTPIVRQDFLDQAVTTPPPTDNVILDTVDANTKLPAHSSAPVHYVTTPDNSGMQLFLDGVYPFTLIILGTAGTDGQYSEIARTQILVPSFLTKPAPVEVAWVWPLIDRPHRSLSDSVFTDDLLATSVAANGRLGRALHSAEIATTAGVHLTLMVDPELLESLTIMASGYRVRAGTASVAGTGQAAAAAWLQKFSVLRASQDVSLTAYADPDIDAITRAGLRYSTALDPQVQARLQPTLSGDFTSDVSWPADGVITAKALDAAVASGAASVIVSDRSFPAPDPTAVQPNALTPLPSASAQANGLVTDTAIQGLAADLLKSPPTAAASQQILLSELAVRAAQEPAKPHFLLITPSRYVDADPVVAANLIESTVTAGFSTSIRISDAIQAVNPSDRGPMTAPAEARSSELSAGSLATLAALSTEVDSLRHVFSPADASLLLGGFNSAALRAQSNGWRSNRAGAGAVMADVQAEATQLTNAIHLVQPTNGTYSLSSQDSPVVVTVENSLAQNVTVRIGVQPGLGVLGFKAEPLSSQTIPAHSKSTISIPTHVERLGKFKVFATLSTPDGRPLGAEVPLTLRVTAIGGITKAITGFAGLVLVLALLLRLGRRIRGTRRSARNGPGAAAVPATGIIPETTLPTPSSPAR